MIKMGFIGGRATTHYYCGKCKEFHRYNSKIGKSHFEYFEG
jgi:hypothetical protein